MADRVDLNKSKFGGEGERKLKVKKLDEQMVQERKIEKKSSVGVNWQTEVKNSVEFNDMYQIYFCYCRKAAVAHIVSIKELAVSTATSKIQVCVSLLITFFCNLQVEKVCFSYASGCRDGQDDFINP